MDSRPGRKPLLIDRLGPKVSFPVDLAYVIIASGAAFVTAIVTVAALARNLP